MFFSYTLLAQCSLYTRANVCGFESGSVEKQLNVNTKQMFSHQSMYAHYSLDL